MDIYVKTYAFSFSEMTYNVSMGTLNPTIPYHTILPKNSNYYYIFEVVMQSCLWSPSSIS